MKPIDYYRATLVSEQERQRVEAERRLVEEAHQQQVCHCLLVGCAVLAVILMVLALAFTILHT